MSRKFEAFAKTTSAIQAKQWWYEQKGWVFILPKFKPLVPETFTFQEALEQISPREVTVKN